MACVNQTRPHCVNQIGKTQSKPSAERHGMCELAMGAAHDFEHTVQVEAVPSLLHAGSGGCAVEMACWAAILTLTFGTTSAAQLSALRSGRT
jgi:hypothetical protein